MSARQEPSSNSCGDFIFLKINVFEKISVSRRRNVLKVPSGVLVKPASEYFCASESLPSHS